MQLVSDGFNILQMNGLTHAHVDNWTYVKKINIPF
jgi:hypothetical protein